MPSFVDRNALLLDIVESVLTTSPVTLDTLSPEHLEALEHAARRQRLTPLGLLHIARAEVLSSIARQRETTAITARIRAST